MGATFWSRVIPLIREAGSILVYNVPGHGASAGGTQRDYSRMQTARRNIGQMLSYK